jgi:arginyl-tRNA synthetase
MDIQQEIADNLKGIVNRMGVLADTVKVEIPAQSSFGDMTSNIAMQISKQLNANPVDIAKEIVKDFPKNEYIEKIEIVSPGFINFFFSDKYLLEVLKEINTNKEYFNIDILKGKRYVVEYTDPNPFKIFHIGHLYTNMVGESFARLTEALGASVVRANYQGDVGLHVAKTMWGLEKMLKDDGITFNDLAKRSLDQKVKYLGDAYMLGFKMYDDIKDKEIIDEIRNINYYIFSLYIKSLPKREFFDELDKRQVKEMYFESRKWCLESFEKIYKRTGTKFDKYYFESQMGEDAIKIVRENMNGKGKDIFKESEGSVIYEGDPQKGLHTRVFLNKEGLPTYESKEIALALKKYEDFNFDKSIILLLTSKPLISM